MALNRDMNPDARTMALLRRARAPVMPVVALLLTLTTTVSAQVDSGPPIPRELLRALVETATFGCRNDISVDDLPEGITGDLLPASAQVLGGIRTCFGSVAILRDASATTVVRDSLNRRLRGLGFQDAPTPPEPRDPGFVMGANISAERNQFCRGREAVGFMLQPGAAGGTRILLSRSRESGTLCDDALRAAQPEPQGSTSALPVPTLLPPRDVTVSATAFNSHSSNELPGFEASARAATTLSLAQLLTGYSEKIVAAGWTPLDSLLTSSVGLHTFKLTDSAGHLWLADLSASMFPGQNVFDLRFRGRRR